MRTILAAAFAGRGPGLEVLPDLEVCLKPVVKGSDGIMEDCYGIAMKTISTNQTIKSCKLAPRSHFLVFFPSHENRELQFDMPVI